MTSPLTAPTPTSTPPPNFTVTVLVRSGSGSIASIEFVPKRTALVDTCAFNGNFATKSAISAEILDGFTIMPRFEHECQVKQEKNVPWVFAMSCEYLTRIRSYMHVPTICAYHYMVVSDVSSIVMVDNHTEKKLDIEFLKLMFQKNVADKICEFVDKSFTATITEEFFNRYNYKLAIIATVVAFLRKNFHVLKAVKKFDRYAYLNALGMLYHTAEYVNVARSRSHSFTEHVRMALYSKEYIKDRVEAIAVSMSLINA